MGRRNRKEVKSMNWKRVKALKYFEYISEFEKEHQIKFSQSFIDCVKENNGGRPEYTIFDTNVVKERTIKRLLSFNKDDIENIWSFNEPGDNFYPGYIVFAIDNFGNYICFDCSQRICFVNLDDGSVETIEESFDNFLNCLYSI